MMKSKSTRALAGVLTAALAIAALPFTAQAAAPTVESDEAVYVNLDHYGGLTDMRIVKGVSLNGHTSFTDYGSYAGVFSMVSADTPSVADESVTWNLQDPAQSRFYYECTPKNTDDMQMPWTFDVSYKLDGVASTAEACAGAAGVVETSIHCIPNEKADEYYRNNMMLAVSTGIDLSKMKSIDAPDAQIQSLGSYKMVVYIAVPGEEATFTYRIGADEYESLGVFMMMAPVTLSQVDKVRDLRDMKDTIGSSGDDLYAGVSSMLTTMTGMQSGLQTMITGIEGINGVRQALNASRDSTLSPDIDATLAAIDDLAGRSDSAIPELLRTQETLTSAQSTTSALIDTLTGMQDDLTDLGGQLTDFSAELTEMQKLLTDLHKAKDVSIFSYSNLQNSMSSLQSSLSSMTSSLGDAQFSLGILGGLPGIPNLGAAENVLSDTQTVLDDTGDLLGSLQSLVSFLNRMEKAVDAHKTLPDNMAATIKQSVDTAAAMVATLQTLTSEIGELKPTLEQLTADVVSMLQKLAEMTASAKTTLDTSYKALSDLQITLRLQRSAMDESTSAAMDGLLDVLQKTTGAQSTNDLMQTAADSIHASIKSEMGSVEDDNNLLNLNNTLPMRSFTSPNNLTPASLQFIVRTAEINIDEIANITVDEPATQDVGVLQRILEIFRKISAAISSVFSSDEA